MEGTRGFDGLSIGFGEKDGCVLGVPLDVENPLEPGDGTVRLQHEVVLSIGEHEAELKTLPALPRRFVLDHCRLL
jgi:hypothetical protein